MNGQIKIAKTNRRSRSSCQLTRFAPLLNRTRFSVHTPPGCLSELPNHRTRGRISPFRQPETSWRRRSCSSRNRAMHFDAGRAQRANGALGETGGERSKQRWGLFDAAAGTEFYNEGSGSRTAPPQRWRLVERRHQIARMNGSSPIIPSAYAIR